jgi:hypothetical protein
MNAFTHPHFADPRWLWLAVAAPLLLLALQRYAAAARRRQLARIATPQFVAELTRSHSPVRRTLKELLLLLTVAALGLALARPQWGERTLVEEELTGEDLLFAQHVVHGCRAQPHRTRPAGPVELPPPPAGGPGGAGGLQRRGLSAMSADL